MAAETTPLDGSRYLVQISTDSGTTWSTLGWQKESSMNISTDERDITSKTQEDWKERKPTASSWTISGRCFYVNGTAGSDKLYKDLKATIGSTIMMKQVPILNGTPVSGEIEYEGSGHFASLDVSFPEKETASYQYTFNGSGEIADIVIP